MRLKNKVAIVTGGSRGIGKAVSELFAKEGASVIIWDLLEEGEEVSKQIMAGGGVAEFTKISVTDKEAIETEAERIYKKYNKIDILINNAGITKDRTLHKMSLRGNFGQTNYSATKAGVIAMSKTWTVELGKYGITANALAPGFTLTEMTEQIPKEHIDGMKAQIPLRKVALPIDIAYGYLYLASDEASFVSGICLTIDGGISR